MTGLRSQKLRRIYYRFGAKLTGEVLVFTEQFSNSAGAIGLIRCVYTMCLSAV